MHDEDLKRALKREPPPDGFAARVMARVESERTRVPHPTTPRWWRYAAASIALVTLVGGYGAHHAAERRRAEGARARDQVLLALRIAGEKVRYARNEVRSIGMQHD